MRPLILLPLVALACTPGDSVESQITFLDFARTVDDGFHVKVRFSGEDCVDPASFADSTLGSLETSYLTDDDVKLDGLPFLITDPPTTFLDDEVCGEVVSFGFNDASSLLDEEAVVLNVTGDDQTMSFALDYRTFAVWDLVPDSIIALDTFWGSSIVQTMEGIHPIDPDMTVYVQYDSGREALPATAYTHDGTTLTVTLPDDNPWPDMGDPVFLVFQDVLPALTFETYSNEAGDVSFTFDNNSTVQASRSIE